jgi:exonuclease III
MTQTATSGLLAFLPPLPFFSFLLLGKRKMKIFTWNVNGLRTFVNYDPYVPASFFPPLPLLSPSASLPRSAPIPADRRDFSSPPHSRWYTLKSYDKIFDRLEADVLCVQELKTPRRELTKAMGCPRGYDGPSSG